MGMRVAVYVVVALTAFVDPADGNEMNRICRQPAVPGTPVVVVVVVVVVVFTLNRSFYPTTPAVSPVSFLILHLRYSEYKFCGHSETEKNQISLKNQGRQIKC